MALDENVKVFIMHITSFRLNFMPIHSVCKAQIALLVKKKVKIPNKYLDFSNIFLKKKVSISSETINLNQHAIKLDKSQQPLYRPIYSLEPIEFETLKTYVKTKLANNFI